MRPIRVALSGSGFKFPAHVGALFAVRDAGFTPVEYAGTSGGSIIAALAACGMPLADMRILAMEHDWSGMLSFSPWSLLTKMGYCSGNALMEWLVDQTKGVHFDELPVALTIMASDINNSRPFAFSKQHTPKAQVALASRASAAIPFVYAPIQYGDALLMDGGLVNNIPVDQLVDDSKTTEHLGVQLITKDKPIGAGVYTVFTIVPRIIDLMLDSCENTHVELGTREGATLAFVDTGYASGLDRNMSSAVRARLFNDGYSVVYKQLAALG